MKIGKLEINEIDYAIRANGFLGIKETGKTYAAKWFAERLMDANIPIVAIDPSGVWRYLKVPRPGKKGYPVVVVGDNGDLPLSPDTAADIMRAAMESGISVLFDLFSKRLSKADWRKIVKDVCEVLLYDNQDFGLRHVFLEEAKEYVPQQVYDKLVFSAVEKLIRMGGNSQVGITLINQRAEGINKDVLELCATLFLFKQVGRNSITNLEKWLKKVDMDNREEVVKTLFTLPKGKCWFFDEDSRTPVQIQIPELNTVHPDRRQMTGSTFAQKPVDVSEFVSKMNKALAKRKPVETKQEGARPESKIIEPAHFTDPRIAELEHERDAYKERFEKAFNENSELKNKLTSVRSMLEPQYLSLQNLFTEIGDHKPSQTVNSDAYSLWLAKLQGGERRMLELLLDKKRMTRKQLVILLGVSGRSLQNYVSTLHRANLIRKEGEYLILNELEE